MRQAAVNCGCTFRIVAFQNQNSWYSEGTAFTIKGKSQMDEEKRVEDGTLETQLFSWDGWDGDQECQVFYNPILKSQIGKHLPGTKFDCATILWVEGKLQLQNFGPMVNGHSEAIYTADYKLNLTVGETISE